MTHNQAQNTRKQMQQPYTKRTWSKAWLIGLCVALFVAVLSPIVWLSTRDHDSGTISGQLAPAQAQAQTPATVSTSNAPARVAGISASQDGQSTIVTIRVDRSLSMRAFSLAQPSPRIVLDMPRVNFAFGNGQAGNVAGAGGINSVRFAHKSTAESRIVIDLKTPMRIVKQEFVRNLGGRSMRLELVPTTAAVFANAPPPPKAVAAAASLPVPAPLKQGQSGRRFTIVIDAGHGGKDPGASGLNGTLFEKNVTLASAIALRDYLRRDRRFEVILTRETDMFLTLERRILIARDRRADLFISLHADAAPPTARVAGATVYTLSEEGGQRARRLLNNDNWSIAPANRTQDQSVLDILRDLTQRDTKNQSAIFGQGLIDQIRTVGPVTATSHRRAGFFVLLSPRVPAVLLEMGFLTDNEDAMRLADPQFRSRQMSAAARAISGYFDRLQVVANAGGKAR